MAEMSVSMILALVDKFSGPAKGVESELEKLKRATTTLQDLQKASSPGTWTKQQETIAKARDALIAQQREEKSLATVATETARVQATASRSLREQKIADLRSVHVAR